VFEESNEERAAMSIQRIGSQASQKAPAEHFTGTIRIDPLFQSSLPARAGETIMEHSALNSSVKMPLLGFGVYQVTP
jgi:hypothetical protein